VKLDGAVGDRFFDADYALPEEIIKNSTGKLNVKFVAHKGSVAGGVTISGS
jgi:hypothetical protein